MTLAMFVLLTACGSDNHSADNADANSDRPEAAGAFDDMSESVERARAVEQQVLEQKDKLDAAIDEADPGQEPPGH